MPLNGGARTFADHAEKTEFELIDAGEYEVTLSAEPRLFGQQMTPGLHCKFAIRKDVNQPFGGRCAFETLWLDKDGSGWYDTRKLNAILLTQDNPQLSFMGVDECIQYINGLNMRITIEKKYDEYSGKDRNTVKYLSYAKSKVGNAEPVGAEPAVDTPQIADSDLPF